MSAKYRVSLKVKISVILFCSIMVSGICANYTIDTIEISSDILEEDRTILIIKSSEISDSDSVYIVYVLDGEYSKFRYEQLTEYADINNLILIGIINTDRRRDLIPVKEADNFIMFIKDELIPKIEAELSIKKRILYGHSIAGGFTLYSLVTDPCIFQAYIASSPIPVLKSYNAELFEQIDSKLQEKINLYFSNGSKDMRQIRKGTAELRDNFQISKLTHIQWKHERFDGENHHTSDIISLKRGLNFALEK